MGIRRLTAIGLALAISAGFSPASAITLDLSAAVLGAEPQSLVVLRYSLQKSGTLQLLHFHFDHRSDLHRGSDRPQQFVNVVFQLLSGLWARR